MTIQTGKFITVEGVEGVGKSTNIDTIRQTLEAAGHSVLVTREPGGTGTGERIRDILLDKQEQGMTPMTELLLMFAARAQHLEQVIRPALQAGRWVVSDRFTDSSYAYQGAGRELGEAAVAALEHLVVADHKPDLVLVLDLDVATGLKRAARVAEADRFEAEQVSFFERVREAFIERARQPGYHVIDASKPVESVRQDVRSAVQGLIDGA